MATQTNVPQSISQSKLAVVSFPTTKQSPQIIAQDELCHILSMRQQIEAIETKLKEAETAVRCALESGVEVETGIFKASLKTAERRNVGWKSIVERELGEDYARRVLAATKPDTYTSLIVSA
jgi:hypothetical protein